MAMVKARVICPRPTRARSTAKRLGGAGGKVAQAAGVVEGRKGAQTGEFRLVRMLQRAYGLCAYASLRQTRASCERSG